MMTRVTYEPPPLEIGLTLGLGLTVLSPYYSSFARSLNLRGDERVLDYGSGSGICTRHIAARLDKGGHLDCVDISHGWMQVIRRTLRRYDNISYHLGHITQVDLPDSSYDLVVIHFVLHDIPPADWRVVCHTLARNLKPGGRIVLREPQGHGLSRLDLMCLAENASLDIAYIHNKNSAFMNIYDCCWTAK